MPNFKEAIEVMKRIESTTGTKEGKMMVKGTIIRDGDETIHSSFDNTTTASISSSLFIFTEFCSNIVRTVDPTDKVEFLRINFSDNNELLIAPDGDFQAIVMQEHPLRDLRQRPLKEEKNPGGYLHVQENLFFPSLDNTELPPK